VLIGHFNSNLENISPAVGDEAIYESKFLIPVGFNNNLQSTVLILSLNANICLSM